MAGLSPRAFTSLSFVALVAPSDVFTMTCMSVWSAASVRCGASWVLSSMRPFTTSLPS